MDSKKRGWCFTPMIVVWSVLGFAGVILVGFLFGFAVQYLWNWLMPSLFSLREITYWEAFGIFIFAKLIFGGHHGCGHGKKIKKKMHKKYCGCEDDECSNDWGKWKYYNSYWKSEGKGAFEKYVAKCEEEKNNADAK